MELEESGERKKTLEKVLDQVARIYTYAREEGVVSVRFFNRRQCIKNLRPKNIRKLMASIQYMGGGGTRIGTELKKKKGSRPICNRVEDGEATFGNGHYRWRRKYAYSS
jgi:hypothetical protein